MGTPTEQTYKNCLIVEFGSRDYQAFMFNADGDVVDKNFPTLPEAQKWIENNERK